MRRFRQQQQQQRRVGAPPPPAPQRRAPGPPAGEQPEGAQQPPRPQSGAVQPRTLEQLQQQRQAAQQQLQQQRQAASAAQKQGFAPRPAGAPPPAAAQRRPAAPRDDLFARLADEYGLEEAWRPQVRRGACCGADGQARAGDGLAALRACCPPALARSWHRCTHPPVCRRCRCTSWAVEPTRGRLAPTPLVPPPAPHPILTPPVCRCCCCMSWACGARTSSAWRSRGWRCFRWASSRCAASCASCRTPSGSGAGLHAAVAWRGVLPAAGCSWRRRHRSAHWRRLRGLPCRNADLTKVVAKFPRVLGCKPTALHPRHLSSPNPVRCAATPTWPRWWPSSRAFWSTRASARCARASSSSPASAAWRRPTWPRCVMVQGWAVCVRACGTSRSRACT